MSKARKVIEVMELLSLRTTMDFDHWHNVSVDKDGNGRTLDTVGDHPEHTHVVKDGVALPSENDDHGNHQHEIIHEME